MASASSQLYQRASGLSPGRRVGVAVRPEEEVAQVEMDMAVGRLVHVEVDQERAAVGVGHVQTELLGGLAQCGRLRRLAGVDVAAGLHPDAEAPVEVEHRAAAPDHDARGRHVGRAGVLVAGLGQAGQLAQEALPWPPPRGRGRFVALDERAQVRRGGVHAGTG